MAKLRINKTAVTDMTRGPKDQFFWDDKLTGFGVKVTPAGNKVYLVQYRLGGRGSPTRRYTIGTHGSPWTAEKAREEAERILIEVRQGDDPVEQKRERHRKRKADIELAFSAFAGRFLEDYVRHEWRRSYGFAESILRLHVTPVLKAKPLPSIKLSDLIAVLDKIPAERKALRRNVYAVLRKLFRWAVGRGLDRSPLENYDEAPEGAKSRERVLEDWELRLAWIAAGQLGYPFGPMYRLDILTGQRREEVAGLDWKELKRERSEWHLPASRAKNRKTSVIHLTAMAIAELDALAGCAGAEPDKLKWPRRGLVFTTTGKTSVSGYSRAKKRLDKAMIGLARKEAEAAGEDPEHVEIAPWRGHDFRRTMATNMQKLGVRFEVIEACENRISGVSKTGVAGVYQRHDWSSEKVHAFNLWAAHVRQSVEGPDKSNVVQLDAVRA